LLSQPSSEVDPCLARSPNKKLSSVTILICRRLTALQIIKNNQLHL